MPSTWIIIYPRGNKNRVSTAEICEGLEYEKSDYAIASRREFYDDRQGAWDYARDLAQTHGLTYEPDHDEPAYLD